jgi:hypothetical protein
MMRRIALVVALAPLAAQAAPLPPDYVAFKFAAAKPDSAARSAPMVDENKYDVLLCDTPPATAGSLPGRTVDFATLAMHQVRLRRDLVTLGYPVDVVDSELARSESELLLQIEARPNAGLSTDSEEHSRRRLAGRLNAVRVARRLDVPVIITVGGCGAAEEPVTFRLQPRGQAFVIPAFFFAACRARGVDPYDRRSCTGWGEVLDGRQAYLSGDYVYAANWPGGRTRRGTVRIEGETPPPVVLRPAG